MTVAQLSVFMIGVAKLHLIDLRWFVLATSYGQSLALFCAAGLCVTRPWLHRAKPFRAWLGTWLMSLVLAISWSYGIGVVATVLGFGPGRAGLTDFMMQSLITVALVGFALLRYLFIRAQWRAELTAQAEARVQALQARIRPHFLFNSLNTIASLIADEPERAERATEDLADLFRGSMRRADMMIELSEELQLARKYVAMEERRLGERLQVEWRVEELPADAQVQPMLLQPLLENAVGHGIQQLPDGGRLRLYGSNEEGSLVITISNPVLADSERPLRHDEHHNMALRNIRARLRLAWGERASLVTHQDDSTFFAVLTLPYVKSINRR
jgi:two-component system sensor histidine kinase AlgZ